VQHYGTGAAALVFASSVNMTNITMTGNTLQCLNNSAGGSALQVTNSGSYVIEPLNLVNNDLENVSNSRPAVTINEVTVGNFTGNNMTANGNAVAFLLQNSTQVRVTNGTISSVGSVAIQTGGTCTTSYIDKSVNWGPSSALDNAATGCNVEWRDSTVPPAAGTWTVGDHVQQSIPVSGTPPGAYCTIAGTPGTWKTEANLS